MNWSVCLYLVCFLSVPHISVQQDTAEEAEDGDFYKVGPGDVIDSTDQNDIDEALEDVIKEVDGLLVYNIAAIGLANDGGSQLNDPRWYLDNGELVTAPAFNISVGYTGLEGFPSADGSTFGPEGVMSYDIVGTSYMVVVSWSVPWNDVFYEENFNVKIYPNIMEVNEELHDQMMHYGYWEASNGQYETRREYGVDILGIMTEADYAKIIVWIDSSEFDENEGPERTTGCDYHPWWFGNHCWRTCNLGYCWIDKDCSGEADCLWEDTKDYPCVEGHDGC